MNHHAAQASELAAIAYRRGATHTTVPARLLTDLAAAIARAETQRDAAATYIRTLEQKLEAATQQEEDTP